MSWLFPNYSRKDFEIIKGNGCKVYDQNNQEYLDLTSGIGVTNLGHNHPELKKALLQQINNIWHMPNLYHSEIQ